LLIERFPFKMSEITLLAPITGDQIALPKLAILH
jgi:hypothetical protein